MNEKIFFQLMDSIRGIATPHASLSLILQLLCWQKLSKDLDVPVELRFETVADQGLAEQVVALRQLQPYAMFPFIDEGVWQSLHGVRDLSPLMQKIRALEAQGLLDALTVDDTCFWAADYSQGIFGYAPTLCNLLVALAEITPQQKVYVPWEGSGQIAARALRSNAKVWVESQTPTTPAQVLNLINPADWELHPTNPVQAPAALEKAQLIQFDAAVCTPPMGVRYSPEISGNDLWGRFEEKTPVGNVLHIQHLLAQTKGRIVVTVPNSVLFGKGAEKQLREYLLKHGYLHIVIALPAGLCTHTAIPLTILVMSKSRRTDAIRFVNADTDEFRELSAKKRCALKNVPDLLALIANTSTSAFAASIPISQIADNDFSLEVNRYVLDESARRLNESLTRYETRKLGELFDIIRPRQHTTASRGEQVWEVQAQDIPQYGYIKNASKETQFDLDSPKSNSYFIRPNDVLMTFKGVVGKTGIAGDVPKSGKDGWITGQSLVILRCRFPEIYPPKALLIYLRSAMGQGLLSRMAVGASIPSLQLSALKELEIPMPSVEVMQPMVLAFDEEAQIQAEIERLRNRQTELSSDFWSL
ncbi:N-6 DNA methylase [Pseudomonas sp. LFS044]|uniref:N-6 DNA methylase n=1 Tax=Pseudomonas sp. LFS044 TaxID=3229880 RepID=UPI003A80B09E